MELLLLVLADVLCCIMWITWTVIESKKSKAFFILSFLGSICFAILTIMHIFLLR